ncbi:SdiA-regulated domain-containing protein [Porticoccus hydrocarbonoclasticus]|uniref:SdiA-regulated domain-containing protein n=1 Tax=Porticoccus hydrocarbonoclasticus TaxID=1073414 RepID=UPI000A470FCF|nr:SdiA-regulated domain-containing protein [Porticoccus hydrocarbonoclasticus]
MDLSRYRVTIDGKTIPALEDDLSALTYNLEKNTLWALLNSDPVVVELSLEGELLRSIRIEGVRDMEGFTHVSGDRYVIAEERTPRLLVVDIPDGVERVHTEGVPTLVVGIGSDTNKGFEGLSWDDDGQRLLVVKERNPMRVIEITGFVSFVVGEPMNIGIREIKSPDSPELFMRDLSSITHVRGVGHKLFLSDESHMLVEYNDERQSISLLDLRAGRSGLVSTIPQAEGVAVDSELNIYIVSEPNLFYRFSPQ